MIQFPYAKINIGLHVTAKRPDGFHTIDTLFYPIGLHDALEVVPADTFSMTLYGMPVDGKSDDNLCVKAYKLLQADFNLPPVAIYLYKAIPSGAGLGGGSSDATHTLLLLDKLFELRLSLKQLETYAARLGSDCAFFVHQQPMLAGGRGEVLSTAPVLALQSYYIVLAKPPVHVSTAEAYAGIVPKQPAQPLVQLLTLPVNTWRHNIVNDFELSVFVKHPILAQLKQQFYHFGATYAAMSGSGSTIYGLFAGETVAQHAAQQLPHVVYCGKML